MATTAIPTHRILRDEILVLRQLLGYAPASILPKLNLELPDSLWDILFVAVNFDTFQGYEAVIPDQQFNIGISILDTRRLQCLINISQSANSVAHPSDGAPEDTVSFQASNTTKPPETVMSSSGQPISDDSSREMTSIKEQVTYIGRQETSPKESRAFSEALQTAIQSYQFTIGDTQYCKKASKRFLFGESKSLRGLEELRLIFASLVPPNRKPVLVLHGANEDLKVLTNSGIDIAPLYVLDTVKAAQTPLRLSYRYSLEMLLDTLRIPYAHLHAAGNDAHFCLRALLMLAVVDGEHLRSENHSDGLDGLNGLHNQHNHSHGHLFSVLRALAQAPRPPTRGELDAAFAEENRLQVEARRAEKAASKARRKAKRAERAERRRLERESRLENGAGDDTAASRDGERSTPSSVATEDCTLLAT